MVVRNLALSAEMLPPMLYIFYEQKVTCKGETWKGNMLETEHYRRNVVGALPICTIPLCTSLSMLLSAGCCVSFEPNSKLGLLDSLPNPGVFDEQHRGKSRERRLETRKFRLEGCHWNARQRDCNKTILRSALA